MAVAGTALNTATTAINTISNLSGMGGKAMDMARGFMGGGGQAPSIAMRDLVATSPMEFQGGVASNLAMPQGANLAFQGGNNAIMRQITNPASARFKMGVDDMAIFKGNGGVGGASSGGVGSGGTPIF